jgi:hypothetical protein
MNFDSIGIPLPALLGARKIGASLPSRLQIFKYGRNQTSQGDFFVDDLTIAGVAAFQRANGWERVPIGFEHNIDPGSDEYARTQEPRPVAARGATVEGVPKTGIFLSAISWTAEGEARAENYEDLSATPIYDTKTRRIVGIASVSLVRKGSQYNLTLDNAALARLSAAFAEIAPGAGAVDLANLEPAGTLHGRARLIAAFERENAGNQPARAARLNAVDGDSIAASRLSGFERVTAAFESQNKLRIQQSQARLSAESREPLEAGLRGRDRLVAAFQRDNDARDSAAGQGAGRAILSAEAASLAGAMAGYDRMIASLKEARNV